MEREEGIHSGEVTIGRGPVGRDTGGPELEGLDGDPRGQGLDLTKSGLQL